jgi:hypothetical protein
MQLYRAFSEVHVSRYWEIPWQTEGHSLDDISNTVSVALSGVTEALCSALFCVFMACVGYSLNRVFIYDCYMKTNSYKSWKRKFCNLFSATTCPSPSGYTISKLVKVWTNDILIGRRLLKQNHVLNEEKLDQISHQLEYCPKKSLLQLA